MTHTHTQLIYTGKLASYDMQTKKRTYSRVKDNADRSLQRHTTDPLMHGITHIYTHTHTHTVGTQERSQETGNDSRRKRPFQREDRYHQAAIKKNKGRRERGEDRGHDVQYSGRKKQEKH